MSNFKVAALGIMMALLAAPTWAQGRGSAEPAPAPNAPAPNATSPQKPPPAPASAVPPGRPHVQLRIQVVLTKYQGDKKLSSLPYSLAVSTLNDTTRLRTGARVPVPSQTMSGPDRVMVPSYSYNEIGTSIDCSARLLGDSQFSLNITVSDTSVQMSPGQASSGTAIATNAPTFRNFSTSNTLIFRDGQSEQITTAADPLTGEVMRVDVTLTVVK